MRRAMMRVSLELLSGLLRGRWPVGGCVWTDAPSDLSVVSVEHPPAGYGHLWFYVILESAAFDPVEDGASYPEIEPFKYKSTLP
jgi:hypothetical protein